MKIVELAASNYKKIRAINITPDAHFQVISGENGAGKSTVTEIITSTLEGARAINGDPITYGEDGGWTRVDLGELVAERTYAKDGKTRLKLWGKDGMKYSNPQTVIEGMYGALGFDPTRFRDLPPAEQAKVLRELANVDVDFAQIDADNKENYAERTVFNRDAKALEATINSLLPEIEGFDGKEVVLAEHLDQLEAAEKKIAELTELQRNRDSVVQQQRDKWNECDRLQKQIESLQGQLKQAENEEHELAHRIPILDEEIANFKAPTPEKIQAKRDYIKNIEGHNNKVKTKQRVAELEEKLAHLNEESDNCTKAIEYRNKQAAEAIAVAKLPVDGLAFTADGVTYNGQPYSHLSDGEQTKVAFYIGLASCSNTQLKVMICRKAALLDKKAMAILQELAVKEDVQIFAERVDAEPASIIIEDGAVVGE